MDTAGQNEKNRQHPDEDLNAEAAEVFETVNASGKHALGKGQGDGPLRKTTKTAPLSFDTSMRHDRTDDVLLRSGNQPEVDQSIYPASTLPGNAAHDNLASTVLDRYASGYESHTTMIAAEACKALERDRHNQSSFGSLALFRPSDLEESHDASLRHPRNISIPGPVVSNLGNPIQSNNQTPHEAQASASMDEANNSNTSTAPVPVSRHSVSQLLAKPGQSCINQ